MLIVEDNVTDAMIAEAGVQKAAGGRSTVLRTDHVARGLALIESQDVHLVLLDLNLPDSKGMDTLRRVRAATSSPIIVITSEDAPGLDEEALQEGAFEILHKGQVGVDALARLLRLAEREVQTRLQLEAAARRDTERRDSGRRYAARTRTLNQPHFRSPSRAREYLETIRWPFGPVCVHCGATHGHRWSDAIGAPGYWTCGTCGGRFSVASGTIFELPDVPLHVWLQAVYLLCSYEGRTSSRQLQRILGVTGRTAWHITEHIRRAMAPQGG